uniref:TPR_REGION domain-containing protein n=1 Tax=Angiostrongylus cantonensis TaxID=6313 RepID=A0A0K0CU01_ANGCA
MFRRAVCRVLASAAGVQLCATAVCLTDKELAKKPDWYKKDVLELEESLKRLGRHGFINSPSVLQKSYEALKKFSDFSNVEVQWRLARACVEKAGFTKCHKERAHLLHEAVDYAKKALSLEGDNQNAGAHKWYHLDSSILFNFFFFKLQDIERKVDRSADVIKHLEMASKLDKNDAYTVHLLGVTHYNRNNYAEALSLFQKAEQIKEKFSVKNLYYIGLVQQATGKKEEAIKSYIAAYRSPAQNECDLNARFLAKAKLMKLKVKPEDYEVEEY